MMTQEKFETFFNWYLKVNTNLDKELSKKAQYVLLKLIQESIKVDNKRLILCYSFMEKEFGCSHDYLRTAFKELETKNLALRSYTIKKPKMQINLNFDRLMHLCELENIQTTIFN